MQRGRAQEVSSQALVAAPLASLLTVAAWPVMARWIEFPVDERPIQVETIAPRGGWQVAQVAAGDWEPDLVSPVQCTFKRLRAATRVPSGFILACTAARSRAPELVNTLNQIASTNANAGGL